MKKSRQEKNISDKISRKLEPKKPNSYALTFDQTAENWSLAKAVQLKSDVDLHKRPKPAFVIWAFLVLELGRKLNLMSLEVPRIAIVLLWEDFFCLIFVVLFSTDDDDG